MSYSNRRREASDKIVDLIAEAKSKYQEAQRLADKFNIPISNPFKPENTKEGWDESDEDWSESSANC